MCKKILLLLFVLFPFVSFSQYFIQTTVRKKTILRKTEFPYSLTTPRIKVPEGAEVKVIDWFNDKFVYLVEYAGKKYTLESTEVMPSDELDHFRDLCIKKSIRKEEGKRFKPEFEFKIKVAIRHLEFGHNDLAKKSYSEAFGLLPDSTYIDDEMSEVASTFNALLTKKYDALVCAGDSLFGLEKYHDAKFKYQRAESYIRSQEIIDKIEASEKAYWRTIQVSKDAREKQEQEKKQKAKEEQQRQEQQRIKFIRNNFDQVTASKILNRQVWIGMTTEMAILSLGNPSDINKTVTAYGSHEQWVYNYRTIDYLYFDNGILTGWQE